MAYHNGKCAVCACMLMIIRLIVQIEHTLRCNLPMFRWIFKLFPLIDTAIYQRVNIWCAICVQCIPCSWQHHHQHQQYIVYCSTLKTFNQIEIVCTCDEKKTRISFIFSAQFKLRIIFFAHSLANTYAPNTLCCSNVILTIIHAHISLNAHTIKRIYLMPLNCLSYIMDIRYNFKRGMDAA